jgi:FkbM family methyltransferase
LARLRQLATRWTWFTSRVEARLRQLILRLLLGFPRASGGQRLIRLGTDYGGWIIPDAMQRSAICYSAGIGEDASFDISVMERYGCSVYAFDPTPRAIEYAHEVAKRYPQFCFRPWGLWSRDETRKFFAPENPAHVSHSITNLRGTFDYFEAQCFCISTIMSGFGHTRIDLLKMDIEGAEYDVIASLLGSNLRPLILCIDFDQPMPLGATVRAVTDLKAVGYAVVAMEAWNLTLVHSSFQPAPI